VPASPETFDGVVVVNAAQHILGRFDTFKHRTTPEVAPNDKELHGRHSRVCQQQCPHSRSKEKQLLE
jgi:hypothetical protein